MPMGILEPTSSGHVPGTTRYFDDPDRPQIATNEHTGLKCDRSGPVPIILIPQPSDDPNDPLNWPLWRRDLITFVLSMSAIFATSLGPILASNTIVIVVLFEKSFTKVALLTGYFLLGAGAAAVFFVPSGRVWGKRHAFIIGLIILVFSSVWAGKVGTDYGSFLAARVIQGVGCAPFETLVNAAVGDLYFVHQRGLRMAFTNLAVFGGAFFTPIVVGNITHSLGWPWSFFFVAIFCGVCLPAVIFLCPETAFRRDAKLNTDMVPLQSDSETEQQGEPSSSMEVKQELVPGAENSNAAGTEGAGRQLETGLGPVAERSWIQTLSPFNGRKTDDSFWKLLLRPFPLFFQPAFLWACLIQGTMIGWTVFIGVIIAFLFMGPPYFWNEVKNGYTYTGAFVGAIAGFVIAGLMADWSVKFMTRRNNGIYEPEFRILMVFPMFIIGGIGLYGFSWTASRIITNEFHYTIPIMFFGFQVAGMVIGAVGSSLYIVDAYRDLAIEGFTMMIIFKNLFSFVLTFYAYEWVTRGKGISYTMNTIGHIQVAICVTSIPMYIFGKRIRAFFHKHDLLAMTGTR